LAAQIISRAINDKQVRTATRLLNVEF